MNSGGAVVGALRGVLVLDTGDWTPAISRARGDIATIRTAFEGLSRTFDEFARKTRNVAVGLTAGITVPLGALAVASNRTASGFEASMKRVEAALKGVTGKELKQLSDQARELAPRVGKGATEAADGIEALGLAGVSTADIMGGALKASLDLAAAGAVELAPATSLVTDVMGQFKKTSADLPAVVQNVVGALDASKFGFIDFQQALAQGGGVAAEAGISFSDFATAVAATSTLFSSGSDAGTSFKTYIQSLVPISKEAEFAMKKLGIEFFDVRTGRMKPLAEQAEILRKALGGLSDQSKTDALKTIFGSDAARTAIGLMSKGRQGIADLQAEIAGGDVGGKIAKRLEGEAAATTRIAVAYEGLKIAIGEAGLTAMITSVKNAFASLLETIAGSPLLVKAGIAFGAMAAAMGPLVGVIALVGKALLVHFIRGFGLVGTAIGLIVAPLQTVIGLIADAGLARALAFAGRAFLGIAGPVGLAVGALLLFKDSIATGLAVVWDVAQRTLGPAFTALFAQVSAVMSTVGQAVSGVMSGPIGAAASVLVTVLRTVLDVAGTFVTAMVEMFGVALVQAIQVGVRAISGIVEVVGDVVGIVAALLTGDFAGAWGETGSAVDAACRAIIDIVSVLLPDLTVPIRVAYEAAKAYLVDGFASIAEGFTGIVAGAVNWVASAFPNVTAAAKGVYEGVKGWLVDKFGALMGWIGRAATWIGDKYVALKERLGLGASGVDTTGEAPTAPKPVTAPPPARGGAVVDFTAPKRTRTKKGRDTKFDNGNREQLADQVALDAARARGDKEAEQRIQDRLALSKQIEAYQRTGLTLDQARVAAQRDMATIQAARAVAVAKEIADERAATALDVARLGSDRQLEASLERQAELKRRIAFYYEQTRNLAEATRLAEADQAQVDAARADIRRRWMDDDAQDRAVRLAQDRGAGEEEIRRLQRVVDIRERARRLEEQGLSASDALARATSEWSEEDKARMQGVFRSTFKDGVRAALDGDLMGFVKGWWKDRVAKGMEEALNSLSDLIQRLFSQAGTGAGGSGGGGILGSIGQVISGLLGGSANARTGIAAPTIAPAPLSVDVAAIPKFATGGSFRVGGMSGIDRNVVSMRLTKGEMVDIRKPGNDNGGAMTIHAPLYLTGAVDLATKTEARQYARAHAAEVAQAMFEQNRRRAGRP